MNVKSRLGRALLEQSSGILHEFVEVEVNANCALELFDFILFEKELVV